jgi:2-methylcitrate dehydratase PrpD
VEVVLRNGERLEAAEEIPLGDRDRPMDDAAVQAKFLSLAEPVVGADRAVRLMAFVEELETLPRLDPLLDLCAPPATTAVHDRHGLRA